MDIVKEFGIEVQKNRMKNDLTQAKLAELCDLSVRAISNIENGVSEPKLSSVVRICNACGISIEKFYPNNNERKGVL